MEKVMNVTALGVVVGSFLFFAAPAVRGVPSTQVTEADPLQRLAFLVGRWQGTSEGQPGVATVQREYTRILNSRFIRGQNRSRYAPQEKNPKGETHEDLGMFSFDTSRRRAVLR